MNPEKIQNLKIDPGAKRRPKKPVWMILFLVILVMAVAGYFVWPRDEDGRRLINTSSKNPATNVAASDPRSSSANNGAVLTVSGYIINKERIELSPRFMGFVKWIGVKKGDSVTNGQVVVLLDDAEQKARVLETEGRHENAKALMSKAELAYQRVSKLATANIESRQVEDDARLNLASARAMVKEVEGQLALAKAHLDWTVIRSPIDGVILEKLVDPNELVVPQSFGGTRGPSTALIALADPKELQVELDINESDLSKVHLNQPCRVSPEAYPEKSYKGVVAEIAPEASRQKGTLQVKVQIIDPDQFLTPELSAKVDFLPASSSGENTGLKN